MSQLAWLRFFYCNTFSKIHQKKYPFPHSLCWCCILWFKQFFCEVSVRNISIDACSKHYYHYDMTDCCTNNMAALIYTKLSITLNPSIARHIVIVPLEKEGTFLLCSHSARFSLFGWLAGKKQDCMKWIVGNTLVGLNTCLWVHCLYMVQMLIFIPLYS